MRRKTFSKAVECVEASTADEIEKLFKSLPFVARQSVEADLRLRGEAQHYDSASRQAYYFTRRGSDLTVWIWCCLGSYDEAAKLLLTLDSRNGPLDEKVASAAFTRATGRSVDEPHPAGG